MSAVRLGVVKLSLSNKQSPAGCRSDWCLANHTSRQQLPDKTNVGSMPRTVTSWKSKLKESEREERIRFPYICDTKDEFSSRVQRIFLFPTFHAKSVHLPHMSSCG
jgi:hypothetical protein